MPKWLEDWLNKLPEWLKNFFQEIVLKFGIPWLVAMLTKKGIAAESPKTQILTAYHEEASKSKDVAKAKAKLKLKALKENKESANAN